MFLYEVIKVLDKEKVKYAVAGGYALALHGIVRATIDVDLCIKLNKNQYKLIEKALNSIGLKSRLPISAEDMDQFRHEYIKNRNLIAWSFVDYKNPAKIVDVLINESLQSKDTSIVSVSGIKISVLSLKRLYKMKKEAGRPKDLEDIKLIQEKLNEKK